jgi:hypothetical protein
MEITGFKQEFHVPSGDVVGIEVKRRHAGEGDYIKVDLPKELPRAIVWIPLREGEIQVRVTIEVKDGILQIAADCDGLLWSEDQAPRLRIKAKGSTVTATALVGDMDESGNPRDGTKVRMLEYPLHELAIEIGGG